MLRTGGIYCANLPYIENVQSGLRPVIVIQNEAANKHAGFVHVVPLTARVDKADHMPTHVKLSPNETNGLSKDSVALVENIRTAPKKCIRECIGYLRTEELDKIAKAMKVQFPFLKG